MMTETGVPGGMKRRDFLAAGAGLFVFFHAEAAPAQEPARLPNRQGGPVDLERLSED